MNLLNIESLMKKFNQISGLDVDLVDSDFRSIISVTTHASNFCNAIHYFDQCKSICQKSDVEHFLMSNKCHDLVTYTCPFGFYTAIAPIIINDDVVAYLIFAPALEAQDGAEQIPIKRASSIIHDINKVHLKLNLQNIPCYNKETLDIYAEFLMLIADRFSQKQLIKFPKQRISALAKDYIDKNISQKFTLNSLSTMLHCSTVTLTQHFKKDYNISIIQYITNKRMELAEELLLETTDSISDISVHCGFADIEYFSRVFKKYHHISPFNYRNQKEKMINSPEK